MQYRDFQDEKLSLYAMGCMRLPVIDGDDNAIDEPAAAAMVDYAREHGVNYFDTAWGYHGGNSELVVGRALARHPRDSFNLADKFPGYDLANFGTVEEIFVVQCSDKTDASAVKVSMQSLLDSQKQEMERYKPEEVARLDNAIFATYGTCVVLCVTNDTDTANAVIKEFVG